MKSLIIIAILGLILSVISAKGSTDCVCKPHLEPLDPTNIPTVFNKIINDLWASPNPALSPEATTMKNELLTLLNHNNPTFFSHVFSVSIWYVPTALHHASHPSLCAFAEVIQGSLEFDKTGDGTLMKSALAMMDEQLNDCSNRIMEIATTNAKCPIVNARITPTTCPAVGTDYFEPAWTSYGAAYPQSYKNAVHALLNSSQSSWSDRALAIIASASLLPAFQDVGKTFDPNSVYQTLSVMLTGPIEPCCCKDFTKRYKKQIETNRKESKRVFDLISKNFPVPVVNESNKDL